jgi:hypothetical protein
MTRRLHLVWLPLLMVACESGPTPPSTVPDEGGEGSPPDSPPDSRPAATFYGASLPAPALLRRASLDLRGVVPTLAELDAVAADPALVDSMIEGFLDDPRYEGRLVDLFAEQLLTRNEEFNIRSWEWGLPPDQDFAYLRAIGNEPPRLMAHIATRDLPWTDVATADYTMANDMLFWLYPLEPLDETDVGEEWRVARYTDDRPAGGVVTTNGLWWRYFTTPSNFNRSRAAALSRLFLCEDYLTRPIQFDAVEILDGGSVDEAIETNPACVTCHSTLDPLAASMFGFWWFDMYSPEDVVRYHPEREGLGKYYLDEDMAWFGQPMADAADLGPMLAADPRFKSCAVQTMAKALWRRPIDLGDFSTLQSVQATFEAGGLRHKVLIQALVKGEDYRVGSLLDGAPAEEENRLSTRRLLAPEVLESAVADLTGFKWTWTGYDELTNDVYGFRVLAGGMDGHDTTQPEREPTLTRALVMKRLAEAAAETVVAKELGTEGAARSLFGAITLDDRPGDEAFTAELTALHRRIHGQRPDAVELVRDEALWTAVESEQGPLAAWTSLLTVWIRDPAFWTY